MVSCSVYKCPSTTQKKIREMSFHRSDSYCILCSYIFRIKNSIEKRFPKDPIRRRLWVLALRRKKFIPTTSSAVCSIHFEEDCFEKWYRYKLLKPDALPTIFPTHPPFWQKKSKLKKPVTVRNPLPPPPKCDPNIFKNKAKSRQTPLEPRNVDASTSPLMWEPKVGQNKFLEDKASKLKVSIANYRHKIKSLTQFIRRYKKRNAAMKSTLKELRKKWIISLLVGQDFEEE